MWCGVLWCAVVCCGVLWCAVVCCGVLWYVVCPGVLMCGGVVRCAVVCCAVVWLFCAMPPWCSKHMFFQKGFVYPILESSHNPNKRETGQ